MELQLNMQAVWDLPTFLWVPEPNTIYNNVFAIEKSSYLEFDGVEVKHANSEIALKMFRFQMKMTGTP